MAPTLFPRHMAGRPHWHPVAWMPIMYEAYQPHVLALHADAEGGMKSLPIKQH